MVNITDIDLLKEIIPLLQPEVIQNISMLVTIFKVAGVAFIIYVVFFIVKTIFDIRSKIFIKKTYQKVNEIDEKLDKILKKKK